MHTHKRIRPSLLAVLSAIFIFSSPVYAAGMNNAFVGNWVGNANNAAGRGASVEVHIWETESKELAGVTHYPGPKCVGYLTQQKSAARMIAFKEEIVQGSGCTTVETVSAALFNSKYLMLNWKDANNKAILSSTLRVFKISEPMKKVVALYRGGVQKAKQQQQQKADEQASKLAVIQSKIQQRISGQEIYQEYFTESELIGAWQGAIYDNTGEYAAEIAFWPGRFMEYRKLVGYIRLADAACVAEVIVDDDAEHRAIGVGTRHIPTDSSNCVAKNKSDYLLPGYGFVELAKNNNELRIYYQASANLDGSQPVQCVEGLIKKGCYLLGAFSRARVSEAMMKVIASSPSTDATDPDASALEVLHAGTSATESMQQEHMVMAAKNKDVVADQLQRSERYRKQQRQAKQDRELLEKVKRGKLSRDSKEYQAYLKQPPKHYDGPFNGLPGGQYLNAIYYGDYDEVKRQDRLYARNMKELTDITAERYGALGTLFGNEQLSDYSKKMENFEDNMTLGVPVIVTYMQNYKTTSARCLTKDAATFTITTTTPDMVTRDGFGGEISRVKGVSSAVNYMVNKEFAESFRAHGEQEPVTPSMLISDNLYNNGKVLSLVSGVTQMMKKYPCDSPEIKKMEKGMLELMALTQ